MKKVQTRRKFLSGLAAGTVSTAVASLIPGCVSPSNLSSSSQPDPPFSPPSSSAASTYQADVVIAGTTPSGIMAAQAAMREGATVAIFDKIGHVGGMLTSGLMTDLVYPQGVGGLTAKFFRDIGKYYGLTGGQRQYKFEPHAAESIFSDYLTSPKCTVILGRTISSAEKQGTEIQSITLDNGSTVHGNQWVDATYEGDLMAAAGASYTVGRENQSQYGETYAGWGVQDWHDLNPYSSGGYLIQGVNADPQEMIGQADQKVMAYTFRNCISSDPSNMIPFPKPMNYSPEQFELTARMIALNSSSTLPEVLTLQACVNSKSCLLSVGWGSSDYVGGSWGYAEADWTTRNRIVINHYNYVAGLLYFLSNDSSVPSSIRLALRAYGLPTDEFLDNEHWPWQMYIREGRRLIGSYVMSQTDITTNPVKPDAIGVNSWALDSHGCDLFAMIQNGVQGTAQDGAFYVTNGAATYQVPFRSILPQPAEVSNLAVPVCISASHIAFSSLRIEPMFMILGESAGIAAGMALNSGIPLSGVSVAALQSKLLGYDSVLALP